MKKTNKLISILLSVAMLLSIVPMNLSVSAVPDTDYNSDTYTNTESTYAASVTDKDGNLIGNYITFEEAATSAKANQNSTLKLLDNADGCYVRVNSPLTLDLNGYTLDMGSQNFDIGSVLEGYDCHLTVTDTSETKTGKITSASYSSTFFVGYLGSPGKLTVLNGILEHNNEFGCTIKLDNKGAVEIKGGTFKNTIGAEFYINKWVDNFEGSFDISGGIFPDGFEMIVYSSDYTSTENYLTDLLADGYCYYDADGKKIAVAEDATSIEGYVQVKECFAASVTDKDGNELEDSPYRTFAEAVTAAENSENSTLTLLDDVSLAYEHYIYPGRFTLDLNGKTLLNKTGGVLYIIDGADLTIKDSGEGGTIRTNAEGLYAIINLGLLTVESGKIYGGGINNDVSGTLAFNGGEIKSDTYSAISNIGTAYIYGGKIETTDLGAIENNNGGTMYIYDGTIIGNTTGISNSGSTYIMGGKITGAGSVAVYIKDGSVEIEGGSFTGKDIESGYYSGTPYGEWTVYCYENANLTLKGGEFPNGLVVTDAAANSYLADGCYYYDADDNLITVADDATKIDGYVQVKSGANLETEAHVTLDEKEFEFTGEEITPEILITVNGKAVESKDFFDFAYENNVNAGTATVTVSGKADSGFTGSVTLEFTILPKKVEVIWSENRDLEDGSVSVEASYRDIKGNTVLISVENGVNSEPGVYIASVVIEDTNYVATNASYKYIVYGDKSLSGTVTSFNSETDEVTLLLYKAGHRENSYEATVTGNSAEYAFEGIAEGEYILEVSKNNHVTRTYEVTVGEDVVTQDAKIHLLGDINGDGKLNSIDVARANANVRGVSALTGYELACADANGDGKANSIDVARMNAHVRGTTALWQ